MTDKQNNPDPIAHAAPLLREAAEELRQAHAYNNSEGWENETDAKAAYDEHMAAAQALEDWEAAVGAGGVQALSAAQTLPESFLRDVVILCNNQGASPESIESFDREDKWIADLWRTANTMLAASPTPPAEQQAATKAVQGEPSNWPETCDGKEQEAWEAWASRNRYDMRQHPLHYLFLHSETDAARQGWKAGLQYAVDHMRKAAPQQEAQEPALFVSPKQLAALTDPDDPEGEHGRYLPARKTSKGLFTQPLYTAPQPAPECHHRPPCAECASLTAQKRQP